MPVIDMVVDKGFLARHKNNEFCDHDVAGRCQEVYDIESYPYNENSNSIKEMWPVECKNTSDDYFQKCVTPTSSSSLDDYTGVLLSSRFSAGSRCLEIGSHALSFNVDTTCGTWPAIRGSLITPSTVTPTFTCMPSMITSSSQDPFLFSETPTSMASSCNNHKSVSSDVGYGSFPSQCNTNDSSGIPYPSEVQCDSDDKDSIRPSCFSHIDHSHPLSNPISLSSERDTHLSQCHASGIGLISEDYFHPMHGAKQLSHNCQQAFAASLNFASETPLSHLSTCSDDLYTGMVSSISKSERDCPMMSGTSSLLVSCTCFINHIPGKEKIDYHAGYAVSRDLGQQSHQASLGQMPSSAV